MTKKVLLALDGSTAAALAISTARTLARQLGAVLHVVHVTAHAEPEGTLRAALGLNGPEFADVPLDLLTDSHGCRVADQPR